jgi:LacI family transcriptional regulator
MISNKPESCLRLSAVLPLSGHGHSLLSGVAAVLKESHLSWSLRPVEPGKGLTERELEEWDPAAVLIQVGHLKAIEWCQKRNRPYILLLGGDSDNRDHPLTASIDDARVGQIAAEYFLARGFDSFGFVGNENHAFSLARQAGFTEVLRKSGKKVDCFLHATPEHEDAQSRKIIYHAAIGRWISELKQPVAILTSNDVEALSTIQAALEAGLKVPDQVAILGAGDDPLLCKLCRPELSSVKLPFYQLGIQAMRQLLYRLEDRNASKAHFILPPLTVITRESTHSKVIADEQVAAAMRYFHRHMDKQVKVQDLLKALKISRANLERRFKAEFNSTPLVELRRLRIEQAQRLLADTKLTNAEIAQKIGISSNVRFVTVFKQMTGVTPARFREEFLAS